jgi:hypothetical protein
VEGQSEALPLLGRPVHAGSELSQLLSPRLRPGLQLQSVLSYVPDSLNVHQSRRVGSWPPADASHQRVAVGQSHQLGARLLRHTRLSRERCNRREGPVHVQEYGRRLGLLRETGEKGGGVHHPYDTPVRLALIGLVAGFFGALFGVGGGIIMVPLLLAVGFAPRRAMATSLAAIGLIALEGTIFYGAHGDLEPLAAAAVGVPAAFGAVAGATLQQRVATRTLSLGFAALLAGVGVKLLI